MLEKCKRANTYMYQEQEKNHIHVASSRNYEHWQTPNIEQTGNIVIRLAPKSDLVIGEVSCQVFELLL